MAARGVYTDTYRTKLAQLAANDLLDADKLAMPVLFFAIGEGGFETQPAGNKTPIEPLSTVTTLVAPTNMADAGGINALGGYFVKQIDPVQVIRVGRDLTVRCTLSADEPGLDLNSKLTGNAGLAPQLFELGIYDGDPINGRATLMAYCTFDEVTKVAGIQITLNVTIRY